MVLKKAEQAELKSRQNTGQWSIQPNLSVGPGNDRYEHEADAVADRVMRMSQPGTIQIQHLEEEEVSEWTKDILNERGLFNYSLTEGKIKKL